MNEQQLSLIQHYVVKVAFYLTVKVSGSQMSLVTVTTYQGRCGSRRKLRNGRYVLSSTPKHPTSSISIPVITPVEA